MTASFEAQWALAGKGMAEHAFGHATSASAMVASARSEIGARFPVSIDRDAHVRIFGWCEQRSRVESRWMRRRILRFLGSVVDNTESQLRRVQSQNLDFGYPGCLRDLDFAGGVTKSGARDRMVKADEAGTLQAPPS